MKSVLHEASTILKAIEKAWEASGKPSEFNVKILEQGAKKLLFFTDKPAIVSIAFDPKYLQKQVVNNALPERISHQNSRGGNNLQDTTPHKNKPRQQESVNRHQSQQRPTPPQRPAVPLQPQARKQQEQRPSPQNNGPSMEASSGQFQQLVAWTPELASIAITELKEILKIMGITTSFQQKIDQKTLTLTFAAPLLENKDEERLLFISLSYLLIQSTKKYEKKKLRGFHLVLTSLPA